MHAVTLSAVVSAALLMSAFVGVSTILLLTMEMPYSVLLVCIVMAGAVAVAVSQARDEISKARKDGRM